VERFLARKYARLYVHHYQPPISCGHHWSRWFGLIFHWRQCSECRMVEGVMPGRAV
jgi:hypothetical protein